MVQIKKHGTNRKNINKTCSASTVVVLTKEHAQAIGFNEVCFDIAKLLIKRPSIDSKKRYKVTTSSVFYLAFNDELNGNYELIKIDSDTFQLEKI